MKEGGLINRVIMKRSRNKILKTPVKKLEYLKEYRQDDHAQEHDREWFDNHPNYMQEWHAKHPGYRKQKSKEWRAQHLQYGCIKSKEWRSAHPDYYSQYRQQRYDVLRKYWRSYKRRIRSQKNVSVSKNMV